VVEDAGITGASTSKEELLGFFRTMYTIRRMEIACDTEYKVRAKAEWGEGQGVRAMRWRQREGAAEARRGATPPVPASSPMQPSPWRRRSER
jgi:hypothetical protein